MRAPETLSPTVTWRLWWWATPVERVPWTPCAGVVRVVRVVVVVVVTAAGVRRVTVVRLGPRSLCLRVGLVRVARTVRGAAVRLIGMMMVCLGVWLFGFEESWFDLDLMD